MTLAGTYKLAVLATAQSDIQVLRVIAGNNGNDVYYCSYRRAVGFDSSLLGQYVDKTSIHTSQGNRSTLFASLADGQSYNNPLFTVTQVSHDAKYAYLRIAFP